jgi:hypothetical protein
VQTLPIWCMPSAIGTVIFTGLTKDFDQAKRLTNGDLPLKRFASCFSGDRLLMHYSSLPESFITLLI